MGTLALGTEYFVFMQMATELAEEVEVPDISCVSTTDRIHNTCITHRLIDIFLTSPFARSSWPPPKAKSPNDAIKEMMKKAGVKSLRNEQT